MVTQGQNKKTLQDPIVHVLVCYEPFYLANRLSLLDNAVLLVAVVAGYRLSFCTSVALPDHSNDFIFAGELYALPGTEPAHCPSSWHLND